MANVVFDAPPTVASFMKSAAFGRLIAGPVGSGKTTGCIMELFRRACEQDAALDGLRYTRFAITRQTLKQLKDTVLKDILDWLGPVCDYRVSESTIYVEVADVRSEWILIPLEDPEDQKRLLSMQLTGAWMSEAIEQDVGLVAAISGRIPRYPTGNRGTPSWHGIIADTNMPTEGSDWHKFMTEDPPDWQFFIQPGGLTSAAENLPHLNQTPETKKLKPDDPVRLAQGRKYYERLARNTNPDWVRRYVHALYGNDPSGTAVFRECFKHTFHVVEGLEPVHGHPLIVGQDFGRDPWSIICQIDHKGRLLVLEEVAAEDIALELHITKSLRPALAHQRYLGKSVALIGDPAGRAKGTIYEETSFEALARMGFAAIPAPTNDIDPRIRSVEAFLLGQRDGGPAVLFDAKRCPTLIKAMGGGYRYGKMKSGQRKPLPDKNDASHPIDAFQYACLAAHGGMSSVIAQRLRQGPRRTPRVRIPAGAWT
jgi:hypothetical protein